MNESMKKILSVLVGYLFIKLVFQTCNDFHTIKVKKK